MFRGALEILMCLLVLYYIVAYFHEVDIMVELTYEYRCMLTTRFTKVSGDIYLTFGTWLKH